MKTRDILLIDEDADFLCLLRRFLELEGFGVAVASSGVNALKMLDNYNFRIIVTDLNTSGMSGLELVARMREQLPGIPVVMITGNAISDVVEEAATAGISEIFFKPVNVQKLVATIRLYLTQRLRSV